MQPDVLNARINLRICELRVLAASTFVQRARHVVTSFAFSFGFFEVRSIARAVAPAATTPP
jgi:hypothetical protein